MSTSSTREYLNRMRDRYAKAPSRAAKPALIDEMCQLLGYHRKHAITLSHIQLVWEALD